MKTPERKNNTSCSYLNVKHTHKLNIILYFICTAVYVRHPSFSSRNPLLLTEHNQHNQQEHSLTNGFEYFSYKYI